MLWWNVSFQSCLLAVRILVSQTGHLTRATMTPDSLLVTSLKGCRNLGYQTRPVLAPPCGNARRALLCWNVSFQSCLLAVRILVSQTGHLTRLTLTTHSLLVTSLKGCRNVRFQTRPVLAPPHGGLRRALLSWNVSFHSCLLAVRILVSQTGHLTKPTLTTHSLLVYTGIARDPSL